MRAGSPRFRRRVLPAMTVGVVAAIIMVSLYSSLQSNNQSFVLGVNWPDPTTYVPGGTPPNVYLQINYTGTGVQDYRFVVMSNSTVLADRTVGVTHKSPFAVYLIAPVPSVVKAMVYKDGIQVYSQSLALG